MEEQGLRIDRRWTRSGTDPLDEVVYELRDSVITNPDGSVVFEMRGAEIPVSWSQLATDIAVSKYFRKAGLKGDAKKGETSARQLVMRVAKTLRESGEQQGGYFASKEDADAFEAELSFLLITQRAAFNSPVWFNLGLYQRYGIEGQGGNWAWDARTDDVVETANAYERPQCSACFIQSVGDDLMSIYDLVKIEARLFKYGSGTGTNFSHLRGRQEKLSGGGTSSGLMSFLEVLDRAAGATKSGGTTRRAAKMVCLDLDHPEIVDFIQWKVREEKKARALIAQGYAADFNGEAYHTVSGQNSNNSIRVADEFMRAIETDGDWQTTMRTTGEVVDTYKARELWRMIADSAWNCADPGLQYDTTINAWHTCPNTDRINASNPCSEYMFLDDTACNLSSINLVKFLDEAGHFDVEGYRHAVRIMLMSQEILVDHSSYPTKRVAKNSHDYRPLGLGYANLGTLLMRLGIPYDSDVGRAWCGALTAILTGHAYRTSAEMAATKGPFPGFMRNRNPMLRVMGKHRDMAYTIDKAEFPAIVGRGETGVPEELLAAAREDWDLAVDIGTQYGYRNAQATVLAPTGTIGLLMDCDTTGIEPDFALVKFKKLAGGGYFKIVNQSVPEALEALGYSPAQVADIVSYVSGTNTFTGAPYLTRSMLIEKGLTESELAKAEKALPGVFDASQALGPWVIGPSAYERLGIKPEMYNKPGFSLLVHFGLTRTQMEELNDVVIGRMTVEGAPHLRLDHYAVFDCANRNGKHGKRYIEPMAHVRMMAAAQPFLSGAISKTVNLPPEATVEEVERIYHEGWKLGLKAVALYRDGCKASQPLSSGDSKEEKKGEAKSEKLAAKSAGFTVPEVVTELPKPRIVDSAKSPPVSVRHRLSKRRSGFTQEAKVAGHKVFLRTGEYQDGSLGEIFIDMHKEGAAFRSLMNCFAISVSMGLQHGVPLSAYVDQFTFTRFEPGGLVEGHPNIKFSTSIIDYVFRVLGVEYLQRYDFAQVPPAETQMELSNPTDADAVQKLPSGGGTDSMAPEAIVKAPQIELTFAGGSVPREQSNPDAASNKGGSVLSQQLSEMMGDAPICDQCGHITVRNGACYKCLNCGASLGCS
ncbi:MAG: vitamin B12-dependent ribonucleotide reductase [Myxococcota bacterium]|nr:vitamin B12-dependent ribonucleotide reductase [Myxococcota bacterium]